MTEPYFIFALSNGIDASTAELIKKWQKFTGACFFCIEMQTCQYQKILIPFAAAHPKTGL